MPTNLSLILIYLSVLIVNTLYAYTCYSLNYRNSNIVIYVAIIDSIISNIAWIYLVRMGVDNYKIFWYSIIWELVMIVPYYLVPIFFFGLAFNIIQLIGLVSIVVGVSLLKLGSPI